MENHTVTNHQIVVTNSTEVGLELHIFRIYSPNKPEQEGSEEPYADPVTPSNVPTPRPTGMHKSLTYGSPYHSPTASPQQAAGYVQYQPSAVVSRGGHVDPTKYIPLEVQIEHSHSVLVKNGEISYIEKGDICDTLLPIVISPVTLESPMPMRLYVFTAGEGYAPEDITEGEPKCQEFRIGVDMADPYVRMISVKHGFYDTLLALYYIDRDCDLSHIPSPNKSALHVCNENGGGFVIPFDDKHITQRFAYNPYTSHIQHVSSKIILSVLDNVKLNDGELLLINLKTTLDFSNLSMYIVSTEIATVSKDMSIAELEEEAIRIGIIEGSSSWADTKEVYNLLFTMPMYSRQYS